MGGQIVFFTPERGVRQGCPLSLYIFILGVEILAEKIRRNNAIKGILVHGKEIKISQYADDTTIILDGSQTSFCPLCVTWNVLVLYLACALTTKEKNRNTLDRILHRTPRNFLS